MCQFPLVVPWYAFLFLHQVESGIYMCVYIHIWILCGLARKCWQCCFCCGVYTLTNSPEDVSACVWHGQSCLTLCDPMDCSLRGSSVHGIILAKILEWIVISFSRGSSQSRDRTWVSCASYIAGGFLSLSYWGCPFSILMKPLKKSIL